MDGWVTIGTELDTKKFDKQIEKVKREISDYENQLNSANELGFGSRDVDELNLKLEQAKNKLIQLTEKQAKMNDIGLPETEELLGSLSKKTSSIIKQVGRWALAIFSVRGAYAMISRASNILQQYNSQYAADLQYIQYALAQTLAPVLEYIVNLAFKLMQYINYISQAWFGVNLFANATAEAFSKANNSASTLKKTLTGFDEMNVVSDASSNSSSNGTPSLDLGEDLIEAEVPSWIQWIAENKDAVLAFVTALAIAIAALKLGELFKNLVDIGTALKPIIEFFTKHGATIAGVISILAGVGLIIDGIIKYLKDPTWENFIEIMAGIALVVGGVALLFGGIPALVTAIILIIGALAVAVYKNWDEIKETLKKVGDWINQNVIQPVKDFFSGLWDKLKTGAQNTWDGIKNVFSKVGSFFKTTFENAWATVKNIFSTGGKIFDGIKDGIVNSFKTIVNAIINGINKVISIPFKGINTALTTVKNIDIFGVKPFKDLIRTINIPQIPKLAVGGIVNMPGRGIPIGNAMAGESGAEGVIPLTDSQAMETLGEAIGRYITINANITNTMNGRVLSRHIQKIQSNQDFAYNT